ncbi:MAG: hypothetical protein HQ536_04895 [Parcubacteria group bacterium]|nr:hypothetical protein [Parcubacteria group bacterium]
MTKELIKQHSPISVILTHAECHTTKPRKPLSILRVAEKCLRSGKSGKAFTTNSIVRKNGPSKITFDLLPKEIQEKAVKSKQKYIKVFVPKGGLPIYAGDDTLEKIKKGKRVIHRKLKFDKKS